MEDDRALSTWGLPDDLEKVSFSYLRRGKTEKALTVDCVCGREGFWLGNQRAVKCPHCGRIYARVGQEVTIVRGERT